MATGPDTFTYWGWGGQSWEVHDEGRWVWIRQTFSSLFLLAGILCFLAPSPNKKLVISFVLGMVCFIFGIRTCLGFSRHLSCLFFRTSLVPSATSPTSSILLILVLFPCTLFIQALDRFLFAPLGRWLFFYIFMLSCYTMLLVLYNS